MIFSKRGFTLVEMIIAITIFSIVSISLYFNFYTGISFYTRVSKDLHRLNDFRLCFAKIEKELRNAVAYEEIFFEGTEKQIHFASLIDVYEKNSIKQELAEITYSLKNKTLYREVNLLSGDTLKGKPDKQKILTAIYTPQFQYAFLGPSRELVWRDTWEMRDEDDETDDLGMPRAIRLSFKYEKMNETKTEKTKRRQKKEDLLAKMLVLEKTLYLPQGGWREAVIG